MRRAHVRFRRTLFPARPGIDLEFERADIAQKKTESGKDFWGVNPKGQVPVLEIDDGQKLTEGPVIVQYLAD